jgi:hypothetical protein
MARKKKKTNPFKAGIAHMLKVGGVDCVANIGGTPTTFQGFYDEITNLETDGGGEVLVRETTLIVKRSIALSLNRNGTVDVNAERDR